MAADMCSNLLPRVLGTSRTRRALCLHPRPGVLCTLVVSAELWSMVCARIANWQLCYAHVEPKAKPMGQAVAARSRAAVMDQRHQIAQEKLQPF